jgi:hypothetical protein
MNEEIHGWLRKELSSIIEDVLAPHFHHINQKLIIIMAALDDLTAQVARNSDVEDSAIALLQGLKKALDAAIASGNPAALTALSTQLGAKTDALAAAVVANTPATPSPAPGA